MIYYHMISPETVARFRLLSAPFERLSDPGVRARFPRTVLGQDQVLLTA